MPARIGRLSAGVGRRHPVTIRKASLMAGLVRQAWALRHQSGAQCSAVECTRAKVDFRRAVAPAPQPEAASRLRSATRDVSFLRSDSRCRRYVRDLSYVTPRYLGSEKKAGFRCWSWLRAQLTFSFVDVKMEGCRHRFCNAALSFEVWRYSPTVAMSLVSTPSTVCQSPSACMIARLSVYSYFMGPVVRRSEI